MDLVVSGVGVLDKAMYVLDVVGYRQPIAFSDLVEEIGIPKTTAHRLVIALETHSFLSRDELGRIVTGSRFSTATLAQVALPIMERLTSDTGESTQLFVRRGEQRLCVASVESSAELRTSLPAGALLPINRGSAGKVLLELADVVRRGRAESVGERAAGVASVSVPIHDKATIVAALCLSGPIERLGPSPGRRFGREVVAAAREIEAAVASQH